MTVAASCPAKLFILGEYAVLDHRPCVVAAIAPRFRLTMTVSIDERSTAFHPNSPAGKLLAKLRAALRDQSPSSADHEFRFEDISGGGLGASTAQFALIWKLTEGKARIDLQSAWWQSAWKLYRELTADSALPPSGADLIAQLTGGLKKITTSASADCTAEDLSEGFEGSSILLFSAAGIAGRKVPTHEHLAALARSGFPRGSTMLLQDLEGFTREGANALCNLRISPRSHEALANALNSFARTLECAGLEAAATTEDRRWFRAQPGVRGVKGSGALQADALIVALDPELPPGDPIRDQLIAAATRRGLRLLSDGLYTEAGLT